MPAASRISIPSPPPCHTPNTARVSSRFPWPLRRQHGNARRLYLTT